MRFDGSEDHEPRADPRSALIGLDANALDRHGGREDAVDRFLSLARSGHVRCFIGQGVGAEALQARAAGALCDIAALPHTIIAPAGFPAADRHLARIRVRAIVCGNAKAGRHEADAAHLSAAAEAGCGFFITHDGRILGKRADLQAIALPGLGIVALEEFLVLFDRSERLGF